MLTLQCKSCGNTDTSELTRDAIATWNNAKQCFDFAVIDSGYCEQCESTKHIEFVELESK